MNAIYSLLLGMALVVGAPYWLARMAFSGRYRAGLAGRLGRIPQHLLGAGREAAAAGRDVVWLHAVSVGEVLVAVRLVEELRKILPGCLVAVSTTTETGQQLALKKLGEESPVFYLPLDFATVVRRYLRVLKPRMMVLMESELWPNLICECERAAVPMVVANARISDRSLPRYLKLKRLWKPLLAKISLFLAQDEVSAERLRQIGAPPGRVLTTGNLKYDNRAGAMSPLVAKVREALAPGAVVIVCGSTLEGEEKMLLEAWPEVLKVEPKAVMVLAPRHPDRFGAVAAIVAASGFPLVQASKFETAGIAAGSILLLDTIGDLATLYSLATVAFVGGSLIPKGGHNPLEPAQFGVPVLVGESYENFNEIVTTMRKADAVVLTKRADLAGTLMGMLRRREEARAVGERGRVVFERQSGAAARTVSAIKELLANPDEESR